VITNAGGDSYPSGIYSGTQPGLSGMSVQLNGNCLATSVAPDNTVYLYHKYSGSQLGSIPVTSPQCLSFSTDGNLWVISSNAAGGNLLCYTNLTTTPSLALTLTNFSNPLAVAVCPANPNIIIVADGGTNQWLQAIDETGARRFGHTGFQVRISVQRGRCGHEQILV
jgi:WD40 repeat protein